MPPSPLRLPVDSALPMSELLRRFRAPLGAAPAGLLGGAPTRDSLVRLVVRAVARRDTATLVRAALSMAEFAYFYYPDNPRALPPYELPPHIMWLTMGAQSDKGLSRLLRQYGGTRLRLGGYQCDPRPQIQDGAGGTERIWVRCAVTIRTGRRTAETRALFAAILEREGQFKILSYANDL